MSSEEVMLPVPPAVSAWDTDRIVSRALEVLRLGTEDPDAPRVYDAAQAAMRLVDVYVDAVEDGLPVTPPMEAAAVQVTVEMYRRKDAPFGVIDAWSQDATAIRVSGDPLSGVLLTLLPAKARWGVS